jgi:hypothetical protein
MIKTIKKIRELIDLKGSASKTLPENKVDILRQQIPQDGNIIAKNNRSIKTTTLLIKNLKIIVRMG